MSQLTAILNHDWITLRLRAAADLDNVPDIAAWAQDVQNLLAGIATLP